MTINNRIKKKGSKDGGVKEIEVSYDEEWDFINLRLIDIDNSISEESYYPNDVPDIIKLLEKKYKEWSEMKDCSKCGKRKTTEKLCVACYEEEESERQ